MLLVGDREASHSALRKLNGVHTVYIHCLFFLQFYQRHSWATRPGHAHARHAPRKASSTSRPYAATPCWTGPSSATPSWARARPPAISQRGPLLSAAVHARPLRRPVHARTAAQPAATARKFAWDERAASHSAGREPFRKLRSTPRPGRSSAFAVPRHGGSTRAADVGAGDAAGPNGHERPPADNVRKRAEDERPAADAAVCTGTWNARWPQASAFCSWHGLFSSS
jgi:hypothetical protein